MAYCSCGGTIPTYDSARWYSYNAIMRSNNKLLVVNDETLWYQQYIFTPPRWGSGVLRSVCVSVCMCVRLSASISLEPLDRSLRNLLGRSPVVLARSSSGSIAIRYVLPVLWVTSHLAVMGRMGLAALRYQGESDVYECLVWYCSYTKYYLGRSTYTSADLCFTRDSFFFFPSFFLSSATRGARWTKLNHIRPHGRK